MRPVSSRRPPSPTPAAVTSGSASLVAALALLASLALQCNPTRYVLRRSGPVMHRAVAVLESYRDPEIARQAAPALLALLEGLLASDPENPALLRILCRGLYQYAFGFLQRDYERLRQTDPDAAARLRRRTRAQFVKVYELGLRLLRTHGVSLTFQRTPAAEIRATVARLGKEAVPALTWTAVGAGGALQLGLDQPWLLQMRPGIPILLERAAALDPGYANALPVGALGLYYGRDPNAGGSAIRSQRYFKQALTLTGGQYLLWKVLYAKHWAWQFQSLTHERVGRGSQARRVALSPRNKRDLFVRLLAQVRRFPLRNAPQHRLANTLAKRMARELWKKKDDFLSNAAPAPAIPVAPGVELVSPRGRPHRFAHRRGTP